MARTRDPGGFAALRRLCETEQVSPLTRDLSLRRIAAIMAAKGGLVGDITPGDCLELAAVAEGMRAVPEQGNALLPDAAGGRRVPPEAPASVRMFATRGQLTPGELIGKYRIACGPVRDLLVEYLQEQQLAVDYSTLRAMAHILARLFWRDLEHHNPGISSLRLSPSAAAGWKQRITQKTVPGGTAGGQKSPGRSGGALFTVRAFYLDIAQWAIDDPARWARGPRRARSGPRRSARQGGLPAQGADGPADPRAAARPACPGQVRRRRAEAAAARLAACTAASPGGTFTAGGQTLRRAVLSSGASTRTWAEDPQAAAAGT